MMLAVRKPGYLSLRADGVKEALFKMGLVSFLVLPGVRKSDSRNDGKKGAIIRDSAFLSYGTGTKD